MYYNNLEIVLNSSMPRFYCSDKLYKDYHYYSLLLIQRGSKCVEIIFFFCNNLKCSNALFQNYQELRSYYFDNNAVFLSFEILFNFFLFSAVKICVDFLQS